VTQLRSGIVGGLTCCKIHLLGFVQATNHDAKMLFGLVVVVVVVVVVVSSHRAPDFLTTEGTEVTSLADSPHLGLLRWLLWLQDENSLKPSVIRALVRNL
jgi:hypothetical protein